MSIASEITRLQSVKSDILTAIADKGVTVPSGAKLADCPELISLISGGGGYASLPFVLDVDNFDLTTNNQDGVQFFVKGNLYLTKENGVLRLNNSGVILLDLTQFGEWSRVEIGFEEIPKIASIKVGTGVALEPSSYGYDTNIFNQNGACQMTFPSGFFHNQTLYDDYGNYWERQSRYTRNFNTPVTIKITNTETSQSMTVNDIFFGSVGGYAYPFVGCVNYKDLLRIEHRSSYSSLAIKSLKVE